MTPAPTPQPGILDFFRSRPATAALPEPPVITRELVLARSSEVEPLTPTSELAPTASELAAPPKDENLVDFQLTLYDEWLADWFKEGNLPTHSYNYGKGSRFIEVYNPERAHFPTHDMYGANSREFVLSKEYNVKEHASRFVGGHNNLFGWDRHGKPVNYGYWIPVYNNTIDKIIIEKNHPAEIATRLADWLDAEWKKDAEWNRRMAASRARGEATRARIRLAMRDL